MFLTGRFDPRHHADLTIPWQAQARSAEHTLGEAHGWSSRVARDFDRALIILMSGHGDGDTVGHGELSQALSRYHLRVERTVEVLDHIGVYRDDRVPAFESWLSRKLADLEPGIGTDVDSWLRTLRDGGPRSRPRSLETVLRYINNILTVLLDWSQRCAHLREVTRADVIAAADDLHGGKRHHTLSVLRSLFGHAKKNGTIFRDPSARVRVGQQPYGVILPLHSSEIADALAAATTPSARLVIALAAVHAGRTPPTRM